MKIVLKPHPACKKENNEVIDIYNGSDGMGMLPFASVHIDLFWNAYDRELYERLYRNGESLTVSLVIEGETS